MGSHLLAFKDDRRIPNDSLGRFVGVLAVFFFDHASDAEVLEPPFFVVVVVEGDDCGEHEHARDVVVELEGRR